ncbi:hypothetical protein APHWI1_0238 [Anaplasma phagocytophilum str. ApWI1]|uniref:Uncharacterized protein n=1 Tax=Anaplasma phagocytophilum str. ApWI1 TaxID=1359155 RepID=A0A0F3PYD8_ANAPH|nr:hypothetical protein WSQ_03490 [Anaplasma phagocytophilum str. JM]AGR81959.1 hypothetical protein YYY_03485 [Anaplasma phagocytophilum str. Dog2]KJV59853.1 hypothetical protein APHWEB_1277 [Anaplasma phagocytophilum str. Webster]KJV82927.1 hypothetical protein APHHGE2_1037 [Anaplasma phagocytophilum str. HGE2]KJV85007.1 hypothetical protein APHWI1_0238 [Anaplasma phagocytophilum str. ApWI1]KJV98686.1 hypothetical protein OTSANNIE_1010 [Anaplasma phagocytophilum str. Annie]KJZ98918.1 hypoth
MASFLVFQNMHNFKASMVGESAFFHLHAFYGITIHARYKMLGSR